MTKEKLLKEIEYRIEEYLTYRYEPHSKVVLAELYSLHKWIEEEFNHVDDRRIGEKV